MKVIAKIHTDFNTKFGVPRQAGLVEALEARIVMEPEYRNAEAFRGLEGFSHIWLLWDFSEAHKDEVEAPFQATVRPPRLGGNKRVGVFATRSPYRPNNIGLSSVRLLGIDNTAEGPVLRVSGADLMDGTPIFDIKPYLAFTDSHPDATGGFTEQTRQLSPLSVEIPEEVLAHFLPHQQKALREVLSQDPRPHYQDDPNREYAFEFAGVNIRFRVEDNICKVIN